MTSTISRFHLQLVLSVICALFGTRVLADDWPGWRGVDQNGLTSESDIPLTWSESENLHWKVEISGKGHSSPIVWGDSIFVTSANPEQLTRHLLRVDRETGKTRWDCVISTAPIEPMHRDNTPASTTPITDGEHVFVSFCDNDRLLVAAVDFEGNVAWKAHPGSFSASHGYSTALVLDGKKLFLSGLQDGEDSFLAALDKTTGEVDWKVMRPRAIRSYSAPHLCHLNGRSAVLLSGAEQTIAYDRATGETLWEIDGPAEKTVSSIVCSEQDHLAFVCGGRDNQLYAVQLETPEQASEKSRIAWTATKGVPYMNSPLCHNGLLHVMSDEGVYRCYKTHDGTVLQEKRVGESVKASMVANSDRIYITAVNGKTTVIANNAEFQILAENQLDGSIVASPAISNGDIIIRTETHLVLIREPSFADEPSQLSLQLVAQLGPGPKKENSGIVKSRQWDDVFWMQNDSGDEPRVYAIHRDGTNYQSSRYAESPGVLVGDAINVDWEDITVDSTGNLIVADVGNNANNRRDLVLYYLNEPSPTTGRTTAKKKIFVRFPNQLDFPAPKVDFNFDCEAVFTVGEQVHLLTKHRSDTMTRLYRLDNPLPHETNELTLIDSFDVKGQAVAADATPDGLKLIIATYDRLWLFERTSLDQNFFDANIRCGRYTADQVEAVCFADETTLLLADEATAQLYSVNLDELKQVKSLVD